jgi:hypothetical protein
MSPAIRSILVAACVLAPAVAQAAECTCAHLPVLQAELRNAQRLQANFRNRIPALQAMGEGASQAALQQFAAGDARSGLVPVPGYNGPNEFDYVPQGQNVDPSRFDAFTADQLCRMTDSAAQRLEQAMRATACDGIAEALRAHENVHVNRCRSVGYRGYLGMHGAARAAEEVEAYGAQIAALRGAIADVLARANARILFEQTVRTQMPANPLYTAVTIQSRGELRVTRVAASGDTIRLDGQGSQTTNVSIDGNCRMTGGTPYTIQTRGGLDTDGFEAQLRYAIEGTLPSLGMQCRVPGQGQGYGMSMPVPVDTRGSTPPAANVPLRDGGEFVMDMAQSQAAQMVASSGVRITGQAKLRLECPTR